MDKERILYFKYSFGASIISMKIKLKVVVARKMGVLYSFCVVEMQFRPGYSKACLDRRYGNSNVNRGLVAS